MKTDQVAEHLARMSYAAERIERHSRDAETVRGYCRWYQAALRNLLEDLGLRPKQPWPPITGERYQFSLADYERLLSPNRWAALPERDYEWIPDEARACGAGD